MRTARRSGLKNKIKMENMKYKLTDETKVVGNITLHRIECVTAFGDVECGAKGGWIESEKNLSQSGNAWVGENARVYEDAIVGGHATVRENATARGAAWVGGKARVGERAIVGGKATVGENARVGGDARVGENATVSGTAWVGGDARVGENAWVGENAIVGGKATVGGKAAVGGKATVGGNATVSGNATAYGNAEVDGDAMVFWNVDYIVFKNWWSSGRYFTWTRSNNKWKVGCFYGSGEELIVKAYKDSEISGREYERVVKYVNDILKEEEFNDNGDIYKYEG